MTVNYVTSFSGHISYPGSRVRQKQTDAFWLCRLECNGSSLHHHSLRLDGGKWTLMDE